MSGVLNIETGRLIVKRRDKQSATGDVIQTSGGGGAGGGGSEDILVKLLAVDGVDSGLDADLLDGEEGSFYAPKANSQLTGNTTVEKLVIGNWIIELSTNDLVFKYNNAVKFKLTTAGRIDMTGDAFFGQTL